MKKKTYLAPQVATILCPIDPLLDGFSMPKSEGPGPGHGITIESTNQPLIRNNNSNRSRSLWDE